MKYCSATTAYVLYKFKYSLEDTIRRLQNIADGIDEPKNVDETAFIRLSVEMLRDEMDSIYEDVIENS